MLPQNISSVPQESCTLITAPRNLGGSTLRTFVREIAKAHKMTPGIVLDLRGCSALDSSTLAVVARYKRVFKEHVQLVVADSGPVRRALEVSGLIRTAAPCPSIEEARARILFA